MAITDTIRAIREGAGLTQEAMADRLETTRSNYAYLESRGEKLSIEQLTGIAKALGVSLGEMLGLQSKPTAIDAEQVKQLEKRVGELEELSSLLREKNERIAHHLESSAITMMIEIHAVMIDIAVEKGFLKEENSKGYLTFFETEDGTVDYEFDDEYDVYTNHFLFDILDAKQLERMVDYLPAIHSYCLELLANTDSITNDKLKQAWKDMNDYYYRRSLEPFVPPDPSYHLSLKNK